LPVEEGSGQITFNTLGTQMVICNPYYGINLYDFDRSTGLLSNYRQYPVEFPTVFPDVMGSAFSPNGRFLYVTTVKEIFQYDLEAPDIPASRVLLDTWDGFSDPLPATFLTCQLGPDCKIYIQTNQQARWLHVVHYPDALGQNCYFEQRGFKLPTPNRLSIPFFPNFRLGPSDNPGVPCTSVVHTTAPPTPLPSVSVFPNPATDYLRIVPNRRYEGKGQLLLFNAAGAEVRNLTFNPSAESSMININDLPAGLYWYQVWCDGIVERMDKLIVK
jgi:Secretion system C-terminal sorting domain